MIFHHHLSEEDFKFKEHTSHDLLNADHLVQPTTLSSR